jgi:hypothetical protein
MATINHKTYNEATETFKDFSVYDGKETLIFKVDGADQTVYASNIIGSGIIKTSDNGPLSATAKYLSDGLGNNSVLALSTSRVGINQSNPTSARLEIVESTTAEALRVDGSGSGFALVVNGGTSYKSAIRNASIGASYFSTAAPSNGLIVEGNVGIGTDAPSQKLHVSGGIALFCNTAIGSGADANSGLRIVAPIGTTHYNWMVAAQQNINDAFEITPSTAVAGTTFNSPALSISATTGNVGIGTSAPTEKLDVIGGALAAGNGTIRTGITYSSLGLLGTFTNHDLGLITNGTEKARITAAGNVGIGTSTPTTAKLQIRGTGNTDATNSIFADNSSGAATFAVRDNGDVFMLGNVGIGTGTPTGKLHISGDGAAANLIRLQNTGSGTNGFFDISVTSTDAQLVANYSTTAIPMLFLTGAAERMRITSTGRVGIGTTADYSFNDDAKLAVANTSGNSTISIVSGTGSTGYLAFADGTSGTDRYTGSINYLHASDAMTFNTNAGNERMRIDSAGAVGIGTASPVSKLHVSGADAWMTLQRTSGTTNILDFTDSAAARLGYVGFIFSNLTLNAKAGSDIVFAPNNEERGRFTSNGLTFNGDTAAANALDDYEEGTWTPSVAFGGASVGLTYGRRGGTYTKIGRQVTVCGDLILSAKGSSTGNATIAGLPFTINGSSTDFLQAASFRFAEMSFSGLVQGYGGVSSTIINMEQVTSGAGAAPITDADFEDGTQLMVSLTYFV